MNFLFCYNRYSLIFTTNCIPVKTIEAADEPLRTLFTDHSADIEKHPNFNYLDLKGCGKNADNRISNGDKTRLREFPWMALLNYEAPQGMCMYPNKWREWKKSTVNSKVQNISSNNKT